MNTTTSPSVDDRTTPLARPAARQLGWLSIGLGLAELLAPSRTARATGQRGREPLLRAHGVREIITGIGLLTSRNPTPWLWARVGGDVIDAATAASRLGRTAQGRRAAVSLAAVAGMAAADVACAIANQRADRQAAPPAHDYSRRSGLPAAPDAMRGRALADFTAPDDMVTPASLRPYPLH